MIVVTGATGSLGSGIVRELLERVPAHEIGVSVRDPKKAADLADRGVRVRRGDFSEPASLAHAFEGADRVVIVSMDGLGPDTVAKNAAAARIAQEAGASRVFYTAHQNTSATSPVLFAQDHAGMEAELAKLDVPWTSLRNGFYANTVAQLVAGALESGEIALPADGPISWTSRDDLAAGDATLVAAGIAGNEGPTYDGPTPPLTGSDAVTFDDIAAQLSEAAGRSIRRVVVDDEQWVAAQIADGAPEFVARFMLGMFEGARRGDFDEVGPLLGELIGTRPQPIRAVLEGVVADS